MKQTKRSLQVANGYQDSQGERNGYRQILVRLPNDMFARIAAHAQANGISFASMVRHILREHVDILDYDTRGTDTET